VRTSPTPRRAVPTAVLVLCGLALPMAAGNATAAPAAAAAHAHPGGAFHAVHARAIGSLSLAPSRSGRARLSTSGTSTSTVTAAAATGTTTPVSNFAVNFISDSTSSSWTAPARTAFLAAVNVWSHEIQSKQPLTIEAHATSFPDPALLGDAGPGDFVTQADPDVAYPLAYADAQSTTRVDPTYSDIFAEFNPQRTGLYFGTDGRPGTTQVDFESVVLHELGHGLGLVGAGDMNGARGYNRFQYANGTYGPKGVFDTFTYAASPTATAPITSYANGSTTLGTALEGFPNSSGTPTGGVYWSGTAGRAAGGGAPVRLYAPNPFQSGSSYSHLDESSYPRGSANALMTPQLSAGEAIHDPGPIALGMLSDMGYAVPGAPGSAYTPVTPVRVLDTRYGTGAPAAPVLGGGLVDLKVTGANGVPANATAVVLNVTGVAPTDVTNLRVYPTPGAAFAPPVVSALNLGAGETRANLTTVAVGSGGRVRLRNAVGKVNVLADLAGYYAPAASARYQPLTPVRVLDTRSGLNAPQAPVGPGQSMDLDVVQAGVPSGATAVAVTVTALSASEVTNVRVYPTPASGVTTVPAVSNINITPQQSPTPNLVIVKIGDAGRVRLRNSAGTAQLFVDLAGYYAPGTTGLLFRPVEPSRVLDTRNHTGTASTAPTTLGPAATLDVDLDGVGRIPGLAGAAVVNAAGIAASTTTNLRIYPTPPDGSGPPLTSVLNLSGGQTAADADLAKTGTTHRIRIYNSNGSVGVLADVSGWFGG